MPIPELPATPPRLSRRALLAGSAAVPALLTAAPPSPTPDPLLALRRAWQAADAEAKRLCREFGRVERVRAGLAARRARLTARLAAIEDEQRAVEQRIAGIVAETFATPARSLEGVAAKLAVATEWAADHDDAASPHLLAGLRSTVADLAALTPARA